jgi:hypothetical protein
MIVPIGQSFEICSYKIQKNTVMKKVNAKIALLGVLSLLTFGSLTTSCSKDNDNSEVVPKGSNYKITVTLSNVNQDRDYVSVVVAGGTSAGKNDVWKVNGVVKTGESAIGLSKTDFIGGTKTYVIETTQPIQAFSGGVQIINYGEDLPVNYKIEVDGTVKVNENPTLSGDGANLTKQYSF